MESFLPYPKKLLLWLQQWQCSAMQLGITIICVYLLTRSSWCCAWWRWWPGPACWCSPSSGGWPTASSLCPGILVGSPNRHCCPHCHCPHCTGLSWGHAADLWPPKPRWNIVTCAHTDYHSHSFPASELNSSFSWKLKWQWAKLYLLTKLQELVDTAF